LRSFPLRVLRALCVFLDPNESCSRQAPPAAKAPFGDKAGECEEEDMPLMPQRIRPTFGLRDFAIRQAGDERIEAIERQHFAAGLACEALEQRPIDRQRAKLLRLRLDGP